jgi:aspartyl-tRNA synthetase
MMLGAVLPLFLLAAVPVAADSDETPFSASSDIFTDAAACRDRLEAETAKAQTAYYDAVRGPYEIADGDVRVHMIRAEASGHRIWEHRCLGKELSSRTWNHSMEAAEEAFTVESAVRSAEWLKKDVPEQ